MRTTKTYIVTLTDSVRYMLEVTAADPREAEQKAIEIWNEDFLRFKPLNAGDVHDIVVTEEIGGAK